MFLSHAWQISAVSFQSTQKMYLQFRWTENKKKSFLNTEWPWWLLWMKFGRGEWTLGGVSCFIAAQHLVAINHSDNVNQSWLPNRSCSPGSDCGFLCDICGFNFISTKSLFLFPVLCNGQPEKFIIFICFARDQNKKPDQASFHLRHQQ